MTPDPTPPWLPLLTSIVTTLGEAVAAAAATLVTSFGLFTTTPPAPCAWCATGVPALEAKAATLAPDDPPTTAPIANAARTATLPVRRVHDCVIVGAP